MRLESFFFRRLIFPPRRISTSCSYRCPSISNHPNPVPSRRRLISVKLAPVTKAAPYPDLGRHEAASDAASTADRAARVVAGLPQGLLEGLWTRPNGRVHLWLKPAPAH